MGIGIHSHNHHRVAFGHTYRYNLKVYQVNFDDRKYAFLIEAFSYFSGVIC